MDFSPYECARGSYRNDESIHSPFLSRIDKWIKRKVGKKRRYDKGKRWCMRGARWMRKWSSNIRQKTSLKMPQSIKNIWHAKDNGTWCKPRHDNVLECVQQGASSVHVRCMANAWISTHGAECIKHTTSDQNIINMNNYGDLQSLVLIGDQINNKMPFGRFIEHLECTHYTCMLNKAWTYENLA